MHKSSTVLGTLAAVFGLCATANAQCVPVLGSAGQAQTFCSDFRPLRVASAVLNGSALIWSPSSAALVLLPVYGRLRVVGRTIPMEAVIGRRILPVGRSPERVVYNNPESFPGIVDPGTVLMRLPPAPPRRDP